MFAATSSRSFGKPPSVTPNDLQNSSSSSGSEGSSTLFTSTLNCGVLAGKLGRAVVGGKINADLLRFAGRGADQPLLELRQHAALAER